MVLSSALLLFLLLFHDLCTVTAFLLLRMMATIRSTGFVSSLRCFSLLVFNFFFFHFSYSLPRSSPVRLLLVLLCYASATSNTLSASQGCPLCSLPEQTRRERDRQTDRVRERERERHGESPSSSGEWRRTTVRPVDLMNS